MTINTKELQRFYDVFSPMITCLPTVINAIERDTELQAHVTILQSEADAAIAERDKAKVDQAKVVATANAKLQDIAAKSQEATLAAEEQGKAETARVRVAATQADADIAAQTARVEAARAAATVVENTLHMQAAVAEEEASLRMSELQQQIEGLGAKQALAEKALATLRAKLG